MSRPLARATPAATTDKTFHPLTIAKAGTKKGVETYRTPTPSMGLLAELFVIGFNVLTTFFQSARQAIALIDSVQSESKVFRTSASGTQAACTNMLYG